MGIAQPSRRSGLGIGPSRRTTQLQLRLGWYCLVRTVPERVKFSILNVYQPNFQVFSLFLFDLLKLCLVFYLIVVWSGWLGFAVLRNRSAHLRARSLILITMTNLGVTLGLWRGSYLVYIGGNALSCDWGLAVNQVLVPFVVIPPLLNLVRVINKYNFGLAITRLKLASSARVMSSRPQSFGAKMKGMMRNSSQMSSSRPSSSQPSTKEEISHPYKYLCDCTSIWTMAKGADALKVEEALDSSRNDVVSLYWLRLTTHSWFLLFFLALFCLPFLCFYTYSYLRWPWYGAGCFGCGVSEWETIFLSISVGVIVLFATGLLFRFRSIPDPLNFLSEYCVFLGLACAGLLVGLAMETLFYLQVR